MHILAYILISVILIEALTEILIKSVILKPLRFYLISKINKEQFTYLLSCGYCFSFWVTVFISSMAYWLNKIPQIIDYTIFNFIIIIIITHRLSNVLHGAIDKYFDKRYDIRYNKEN